MWPNIWVDQDETWHAGSTRRWQDCVRWGPSSSPSKRHPLPQFGPICVAAKWLPSYPRKKGTRTSTQFLAHVYRGQTAGRIKMPLGTEVNVGQGDVVLDGVAAPPKWGTSTPFSVHVYCGQTAGRMKTPLGTEVDLGPGHIVLHGVPALHERGTAAPPPSFWPMSVVMVAHFSYCYALVTYYFLLVTFSCKCLLSTSLVLQT